MGLKYNQKVVGYSHDVCIITVYWWMCLSRPVTIVKSQDLKLAKTGDYFALLVEYIAPSSIIKASQ